MAHRLEILNTRDRYCIGDIVLNVGKPYRWSAEDYNRSSLGMQGIGSMRLSKKILASNFPWNDLGRYDLVDREYASRGGYLILRQDGVVECTLYGAFYNMSINVYYVHELQHALRLCRFNEMADNFKIQ